MRTSIYIAKLAIEPEVIPKLCQKHFVTEDEVRGLLEWPARPRAAEEDHPDYGVRWIALVYAQGSAFLAALDPLPDWEGANAELWRLRSAYWL